MILMNTVPVCISLFEGDTVNAVQRGKLEGGLCRHAHELHLIGPFKLRVAKAVEILLLQEGCSIINSFSHHDNIFIT